MQVGELRESAKPVRCAYCQAALAAANGALVVCAGCGTTLHPECAGALARCPTLGCGHALTGPSEAQLPWIRTFLGACLLAAAVASVWFVKPHCDPAVNPGCKKAEVAAAIQVLVYGLPALVLLAPAAWLWLRGRGLRVFHVFVGTLSVLSVVPAFLVTVDPFYRIDTCRIGWFTYSMTWYALGDGDSTLEKTLPSAHSLLVAAVVVQLASWLGREALRSRSALKGIIVPAFLLGGSLGCSSTPGDPCRSYADLREHQRAFSDLAPAGTFSVTTALGNQTRFTVRVGRDEAGLWVDLHFAVENRDLTALDEPLAVALRTRGGATIAPVCSGGRERWIFEWHDSYAGETESFFFGTGIDEREVTEVIVSAAGERHAFSWRPSSTR